MDKMKPTPNGREKRFRLDSFCVIKREQSLTWPATSSKVPLSEGLFRDLLRFALERVRFDERFYLHLYPDVAEAVADGLFEDAHHHYVEFGYFEDRLPFRVDVDESFYFRSYPDIGTEVRLGTLPSAQAHFERHGYKEGRQPREGWSLLAS